MITQVYLDEYEKRKKNYEHEIKRLQREIFEENNKTTTDSVSGSSNTYPFEIKHFKINGKSEKIIKKLEERKERFKKLIEKENKALEYQLKLLTEEDAIMADIIRQKYIQGKEWKQISFNMNYSGESGPRNYFNRFFEQK